MMPYSLRSCFFLCCRFKCGFLLSVNAKPAIEKLKSCKPNPRGDLGSISFYSPSNAPGKAHPFQAVAPSRLPKSNPSARSFTPAIGCESPKEETMAVLNSNERECSHLEDRDQNLQVGVDSETLCSEETPPFGSKTVWESEILIQDVKLLARFRSEHNWVQVLELSRRADHPLAGARVLLLDRPGNIQSVYDPHKILTNAYYDVLASLPPVLPPGPIAIYGLGGGTVAHLLHHFWPGIHIHGWDLDPAVITMARKYFGLSELETDSINDDEPMSGYGGEDSPLDISYPFANSSSNTSSCDYPSGTPLGEIQEERHTLSIHQKTKLRVYVGDALGSEAMVHGGFAGIIVDLFSKGAILPSLQETHTWERMKEKLRPGGRIMVNCGGSCVESESQRDGGLAVEECVATLARVFPGELCKRVIRFNGDNCIALTGPLPDLRAWMRSLPKPLSRGVFDWTTAG